MTFWNEDCDKAFYQLRNVLTEAPILISPDWTKAFRCHTDACQYSVGGTLTQKDANGKDRVVAYFSKRLSAAEVNYSTNDRELLAVIYFLKRFRCYLEGSEFEIITDNQVLKNFMTKRKLSRREARWLELLSDFATWTSSRVRRCFISSTSFYENAAYWKHTNIINSSNARLHPRILKGQTVWSNIEGNGQRFSNKSCRALKN